MESARSVVACNASGSLHTAGHVRVGVFAKRTYDIIDGECVPSSRQAPLTAAPRIVAEPQMRFRDSETMMNRISVDVVVEGHARVPIASPRFDAGLRVGDHQWWIRVSGPRRCEWTNAGRLTFSPPEPISRMALTWQNAYGGIDRVAADTRHDPVKDAAKLMGEEHALTGSFVYPRNPWGKGYVIAPSRDSLRTVELPNLEFAGMALTPASLVLPDAGHWPLAPQPAVWSWLPYTVFPRSCLLGIPPHPYASSLAAQHFPEVQAGFLSSAQVDPRSFDLRNPAVRTTTAGMQTAMPAMRLGSLDEGARIETMNLLRDGGHVGFSLPRGVPRLLIELPGGVARELQPMVASIVLNSDSEQLEIVWRGEFDQREPLSVRALDDARYAAIWPT